MTKLELVNKIFFQWFFIRLAKQSKDGKIIGYAVLYWVLPLTGWTSNYIPIGKLKVTNLIKV